MAVDRGLRIQAFACRHATPRASILDPAGNALEFKAMADPAKLFEKN